METILITGANGFLGQHLVAYLKKSGKKIIATGRGPCRIVSEEPIDYVSADLTDELAVSKLLMDHQPDIVIHNAALSKPDECENDKDGCLVQNLEATRNLLNGTKGHFIYISTDFIFGENGPHSEDDQPDPLNFYGESKWRAEQIVTESNIKTTIVRPVFIYGQVRQGMRPSFLHWVKNNLEQHKAITVVSDQFRTPTYAVDICRGIEKIIEKRITGAFNLAGKDILSPYEMAVKTAEVLKLDASLIESVTAEAFPEPVKRAKRSGLKIDKARRELAYEPVSFEEGLRLTFA